MKKTLWLGIACLLLFSANYESAEPQAFLSASHGQLLESGRPSVIPGFGKTPLYFVPNQGQVDGQALYYAKASAYTLWLTEEGLIFDSTRWSDRAGSEEHGGLAPARDVSRLEFIGSAQKAEAIPTEMTDHKVHYLIGNRPDGWKTDIATSKSVLYREIYENIDLKIYGLEKQVEYDWVVKPGGDPGDIQLRYSGVKSTRINEEGDISVETEFGNLRHKKPSAFQFIDGQKVSVEARFRETDECVYGIAVGEYDGTRELIIDPVIMVGSTYLGGSGLDSGYQVAVDSEGCAYVTGLTSSTNFPLVNPYDSTPAGGSEAFVTKFAADGSSLIYSTYIGGALSTDYARSVQLGGQCAFIAGYTNSTDFPLVKEVDNTFVGDNEAFVLMLSASGNSLLFSTFLGGSGSEEAYGLYAALTGSIGGTDYYDIYVTGNTTSVDFPLQSAFDASLGGVHDAFVTKITYGYVVSAPETSAANLIYSTYLGGSDEDRGFGIDVDGAGYAFVTGYTASVDFPTLYGRTRAASNEAYITQFSQDGTSLVWSTYLGGNGTDRGYSIVIEGNGVVVAGETTSSDFPMVNAYDNTYGGVRDNYFTKARLNVNQTELVYSTYLGGSGEDSHLEGSIAADGDGNITITGYTDSTDFPLSHAVDTTISGYEGFVAKFHFGTSLKLRFSSFLGGSGEDRGHGIAVDGHGAAYVVGRTASTDFPMANAYQGSYGGGGYDSFLTKIYETPVWHPRHAVGDFDGDGSDEAAVDFGTSGIYLYDGGSLTQISTADPESLVAADVDGDSTDDLLADLGTSGLWLWSTGGGWLQLSGVNPEGMAAGDVDDSGTDEVVGDFGAAGMWLYNGGVWSQLSGANADHVDCADLDGSGGEEIIGDFGPMGLWSYNTGAWTQLSGVNADFMTFADTDGFAGAECIGDFGSVGLWLWSSGSGWTQLSGVNADFMKGLEADGDASAEFVADFGAVGLWLWNGGTWDQQSGADAEFMIAADTDGNGTDEGAVDFGALGLWLGDFSSGWSQLTGVDPEFLMAGDFDGDTSVEIMADFGALGLWLWDGGAWSQISASDPD